MSGIAKTVPNGVDLPVDSLEQVFAYEAGQVSTITVQYQGHTYIQTFIWDGDNVASISAWTLQ
jgi:hypothetical protein